MSADIGIEEATVSDFLSLLGSEAGRGAEELRAEIDKAETLWRRLVALSRCAQDSAQLVGASDLEPNTSANVPHASGLVRKRGDEPCDGSYDCPSETHEGGCYSSSRRVEATR